ncbi:hypothetical protein NDU88_007840 [Pleurodeles waltl]|uniref:Uncharacterized protein n=1 Tax=Pleurodeles waltl TaxID=8319 RepID=A0AAV7U1X2_PLEWA|nr:hypothetical protein NDU88_007840 [Pleurodeles waltl]
MLVPDSRECNVFLDLGNDAPSDGVGNSTVTKVGGDVLHMYWYLHYLDLRWGNALMGELLESSDDKWEMES